MLMFSPQTFATVLTGALRMGEAGYQLYVSRLFDEQDIRVYVPTIREVDLDEPPEHYSHAIVQWVVRQIEANGEYKPDGLYEGIFLTPPGQPTVPIYKDGLPQLNPEHPEIFEDALMDLVLENRRQHDADITTHDVKQGLMVFHHKVWADPNETSPVAKFFRKFVDVGLDVVAVQPGLLGVGGNLESLFAALLPNVSEAYDAEDPRSLGILSGLSEAFGEAAIKTLVDNPSLVTDEQKWQPLISGVLRPVQEEVMENGVSAIFAERKLRELIGGPVAFGALSALEANSDEYLKGSFKSGDVLGEIVRETLGATVSGTRDGFRIRKVFSNEGALHIMFSALSVARKRPELFLKKSQTDAGTDQGRKLISLFADAFLSAPAPFYSDKQLAVQLACRSLDVLSNYTAARLSDHAGDEAHRAVRSDMAAHLISDLLEGFSRRLVDDKSHILETVFSRDQVVDVMQIMASHVARSPHHFISEDANPQIVAIAETVALAIAEDTTGLLTGEDWREIIAIAMDAGLRNPGRLFSIDQDSAENSIALAVISRVLASARDGLRTAPTKSGQLLFGETLSEAIRVSLTSIASGALSTIKDPAVRDAHLDEVEHLISRLNGLSQSEDPNLVIGADDWLEIYTYYIAHVIQSGPGTVANMKDDALIAVLENG
ncbi:MAG: hypothetical protein CMK09_07255 [Ponticaulis sp.]|nr:hypothetical protein [Ponticaulis sp.]|tara:strand:+ start:6802 stop:8781 length:1980 start_codon:yes stop_codon:yes gene_type:complete